MVLSRLRLRSVLFGHPSPAQPRCYSICVCVCVICVVFCASYFSLSAALVAAVTPHGPWEGTKTHAPSQALLRCVARRDTRHGSKAVYKTTWELVQSLERACKAYLYRSSTVPLL
ncbi:unnamed protein product [Ectocarpus sp. 6 AP-2014]